MHREISDYEFKKYVYPSFPDAPRLPRKFTIDELVCTFLALHDVEVAPIGADIHMSRSESALMGAAFGLTSPVAWDTMATGAQMKQDARIAARQEWNSWKQWALSHADWPAFKEKANTEYEAAKAISDAWKSEPSNQDKFKSLVEQGLAKQMRDDQMSMRINFLILFVPFALVFVWIIVGFLGRSSDPGYSPRPERPRTEIRY